MNKVKKKVRREAQTIGSYNNKPSDPSFKEREQNKLLAYNTAFPWIAAYDETFAEEGGKIYILCKAKQPYS